MNPVKYKSPEDLVVLTEKSNVRLGSLIRRLKKKKLKNLDEIVHDLHHDMFAEFDCLNCANCCKTLGPRLTEKDIERLAKHLKIKSADFIQKFILIDEDQDFVFRDNPCPFLLENNYCEVYENRPKACREYPHTDRKRFVQILDLSFKNCKTCPVVFNIFDLIERNSQVFFKNA